MNRPHIALTGILLGAALLSGGCAKDTPATTPPADEATNVGHIHGLGVDPADDSLYVATHFGLFHVDQSGQPSRVADRHQDTMAFTVVGPGHFLGSGHPDLREDLPAHLGLIESTDAGETWTALALQGEADFHILEPAGDALYAYEATSGSLLRTKDRRTFDQTYRGPLISVAAVDDNGPLIATNGNGQLVSINPRSGETRELGGPSMMYLDTTPDRTLAGRRRRRSGQHRHGSNLARGRIDRRPTRRVHHQRPGLVRRHRDDRLPVRRWRRHLVPRAVRVEGR